MFFKLLNFLCGYVTITLPEECLEKFVNIATTRRIYLWEITNSIDNQVALKVRLRDVPPLRHIARMTRCRFHIIKRSGVPFFINQLLHRKALLGGALFFIIVLYALSSFIWFIDIQGNKSISDDKIIAVVRQVGVHRGVPKWSVDTAELEKTIIQQLSGLAWVGVTVDGTRLEIEVVEKVLPPDNGAQIVDLVAKKDGLIKEILVLSGHPLVKEGDTVTAGQVLISAAIPPPEDEENDKKIPDVVEEDELQQQVQFVHARGIVRARIWYDGYEEVKLREQEKHPTGQQITKLCMKIGSKEIILMGPRQVPYTNYIEYAEVKRLPSWRNIVIPVEVITIKYTEQRICYHEFNRTEALRLAGEQALEKLRSQMPEHVKILHTDLREVKTANEEDIVRVRLTVETLEEIGVEKPHQ
ncbi:putative stage IV sporulation protein YqfD [Sporotomaculum syntrophicum]|uniref:Stage IV sporulation protein YqfD n=1 Tax=Sporotomaculum syntrophicum TaxID=182264 RepID=A0A9D2WMT7_9FIRM|nr:sporulation protein YqfD [Sporotomaculum syntrophicum]KAF1084079.1 putative stage IV sporulation protein YqfD [Sporotomaculum syntrophicum]